MKERQAFFFTHQFVRLLADFGNVIGFLDQQGYAVAIYTLPSVDSGQLTTYSPKMVGEYMNYLPQNIKVEHLPHALPYRLGRMTPQTLLRTLALAFRLGRVHPDALFVSWGGATNVACGLPLRALNRKCVFMVTGLGLVLGSKDPEVTSRIGYARTVLMNAYKYLLKGRNSRCLNHNADDKAFLSTSLAVDSRKFFVTPGCGVDPKVFPFSETQRDNPCKIILVPGRLIEEKGIREAAAASQILHERGIDHEMWFTGAVEPFTKYTARMGREGSSALTQDDVDCVARENARVKFIGFKLSLLSLYQQCDIVCLSSRYPEGVPTVLIEAASCGRPAVTCDTVRCREIVINEETGLVVPQRDSVALANALQRLIADSGLRERFRQNVHHHFLAGFTKNLALEQTVEAYESLGFSFSGERIAADIRSPEAV